MKRLSNIELRPNERENLMRYLTELKLLLRQEEEMQQQLATIGYNNEDVKLLMTIPGVSYYTAVALIAEIGDIRRFPTKKHLCSYGGLVSKADNSAGRVGKHRSVKKGNTVLKYFLVNAIQGMIKARKNTAIKKFYKRKAKQIGIPKAQVAAARKLACVIWWVLTNKKHYAEEDKFLTERKYIKMKGNASADEKIITQDDINQLVKEIQQKHDVLERLEQETCIP